MSNRQVIVLLLAGGSGNRVQSTRPKQFIEVEGESILLHTMKAFERHPLVNAIVVVCAPAWQDYVMRQAELGRITKMQEPIDGGETSLHSLRNGIRGLMDRQFAEDSIVLVHDSVRPLVSHEIISNNIALCQEQGNAITGLYSQEAYLQTSDGQTSDSYIPRDSLLRAQTPVTFPLGRLAHIMQQAEKKNIVQSQSLFTLANEVGECPLHITQGNTLNFKITMPEDIEIYRRLRHISCLENMSSVRSSDSER